MQAFNYLSFKNTLSILKSCRYLANLAKFSTFSSRNIHKPKDDISLCVAGNGADGNPCSLVLDYNERLFVFNCGEGLQRVLSDYGLKPSKVEHLFLTSNNWNNFSGFSNFALSRQEACMKDFNITGINNENIVKECISFDYKLKRVKFNYLDCLNDDTIFTYDSLEIKHIVFEHEGNKSVAYLGKISEQKGGINLTKCFNLRVPRHLVSNLKNGTSVTLEDGKIISPADVLDPNQPEKRFFVFESLSPNFVSNFEHNSVVSDFLQRCDCIIHFTKDDFLKNSKYQHFIKKYNLSFHLVLSEKNPSLSLHSAHRFQNQLNFVDSKLFPLLKEDINVEKVSLQNVLQNNRVLKPLSGMSFRLRPHFANQDDLFTLERIPDYDLKNRKQALVYKDGSTRDGLDEALHQLHEKQQNIYSDVNLKYPEFVFLGTASSVSLPIRNVSSILVNLSSTESILLDCGENSYGQLLRFYGPENIKQILCNLKAVFISHHHSDHHMGLIQLIERHYELSRKKLLLILPPMVSKFLQSTSLCFPDLSELNSKYNYQFNRYFDDNSQAKLVKLLPSLKAVQLIPVSHCAFAYAISLTTTDNFKFVYSGDTEPCENLVRYGKDCDLLIHESTVEDGLVSFARTTFHSTLSEAIDIGRRMNARFTILTHFSQRYGKLPFMSDEVNGPTVGMAFDNMRISPDEFVRLPLMYDALKCMYSKHIESLQYKREMYSRKYENSG